MKLRRNPSKQTGLPSAESVENKNDMKTAEEIYQEYVGDGQMGIDFEKRHIIEAMKTYAQQFQPSPILLTDEQIENEAEKYASSNEFQYQQARHDFRNGLRRYREILQGQAAGKPDNNIYMRKEAHDYLQKMKAEAPVTVHKDDEGTAQPAPLSLPTYEEREAAISKLFPIEAGSLMDGIITGFHAAIKWYNELLRSEAERRAKG